MDFPRPLFLLVLLQQCLQRRLPRPRPAHATGVCAARGLPQRGAGTARSSGLLCPPPLDFRELLPIMSKLRLQLGSVGGDNLNLAALLLGLLQLLLGVVQNLHRRAQRLLCDYELAV